jgi:hypothetical protein
MGAERKARLLLAQSAYRCRVAALRTTVAMREETPLPTLMLVMRRTTSPDSLEDTRTPGWLMLLRLGLGLLAGGLCFVLLWAGLNVAWGTVLDVAIGPTLVAEPCQRLAKTVEWPTAYTKLQVSRTGRIIQHARCHFGDREVLVNDSTWDREFYWPETVLLFVGLGGYLACIFGAILGTVALASLVRNGWTRLSGWG